MHTLGLRQLSLLALATGMVVLGVAGLIGVVTPSPLLAMILLTTTIALSFDAGRVWKNNQTAIL